MGVATHETKNDKHREGASKVALALNQRYQPGGTLWRIDRPSHKMKKSRTEYPLTIVIAITKASKHPLSTLVDNIHHSDLVTLLTIIQLIDAYRVYPQESSLVVCMSLHQSIMTILSDFERAVIYQDTCSGHLSPSVGDGVVSWSVVYGPSGNGE